MFIHILQSFPFIEQFWLISVQIIPNYVKKSNWSSFITLLYLLYWYYLSLFLSLSKSKYIMKPLHNMYINVIPKCNIRFNSFICIDFRFMKSKTGENWQSFIVPVGAFWRNIRKKNFWKCMTLFLDKERLKRLRKKIWQNIWQ